MYALTEQQVQYMKDTIYDKSLPDRCEIWRDMVTSDGQGGENSVWTKISTVSCRMARLAHRLTSEYEGRVVEEVASRTRWRVALPFGTDINTADRIKVLSCSFVLEVISTDVSRTWAMNSSAACAQINDGQAELTEMT